MPLLDAEAATLTEYLDTGGGRGIRGALANPPEAVIGEVVASGLRGRGGAGFPTGSKWWSVRTAGVGDRYVVCNGAEGEPGTFKDRFLLRRNPYLMLEGLAIAAYAVGARGAFAVLKETFGGELEAVRRAADELRDADLLGDVPVEVVTGPDLYLLGEETGLLEAVERQLPLPRVAKPFVRGLFSTPTRYNPTVVNNVETLSNVPAIMAEGGDAFRRLGTERSPGTMLFTVAGDVVAEGVYELPLGTPMRFLIEDVAGGPAGGRAIKALLPGASNTVVLPEVLDVPLDFESLRAVGGGLGAGSFVVYDDTACMVQVASMFSRFLWIESCGQCPSCKLGCGVVTGCLERLETGHATLDDFERIPARARKVTDGQRCALPTGESLLVQSLYYCFTDEFREHLEAGCAFPRRLDLPKIVDYDEHLGRFVYDRSYSRRQPDWTYAAPPAAAAS
jgi:NADH:ubiquinone oxidoreductase subunit F (NADH-binding)